MGDATTYSALEITQMFFTFNSDIPLVDNLLFVIYSAINVKFTIKP